MLFKPRTSVEQVEEQKELAPKFDEFGLLPVVTTDVKTAEVLMLGYMNQQALECTLQTGEAHYYSRSRKVLWHKGKSSGFVQRVVEMRIDDDQDALWLQVELKGSVEASCHVGYKSCFYRAIDYNAECGSAELVFKEKEKTFNPKLVYGDAPNPTKL